MASRLEMIAAESNLCPKRSVGILPVGPLGGSWRYCPEVACEVSR